MNTSFKKMRIAFVCETSFQMLNMIVYAYQTNSIGLSDIYISITNQNMRKLYNRLKKKKLFNNVYAFYTGDKTTGRIRYYMGRIIDYVLTKKAIEFRLIDKVNLKEKKYDEVIIGCPNQFMVNFCSYYNKSRVGFIEEGTGSYYGRIGDTISTGISDFFGKILKKGPRYIQPNELILYRPEISFSGYDSKLVKLSMSNLDTVKNGIINSIFGIDKSTLYINNKWVYLGQPIPISHPGSVGEDEPVIRQVVFEMCGNILVRKHPGENESKYCGVKCDSKGFQWEMICKDQISENSVLISTFSTAQLTPKMMYDKEPFVVFTFHIISDFCADDQLKRINEMIQAFVGLYKDPSKVFIPLTLEELKRDLQIISERVVI